ncbi:ATP-binding protein [Marinactinospora thermotolerans]|uniref:ATP-binding protein n=1 Tax=Marinactinospora thermotolerans TaxID=531310 RepID=UPI00135662E1|nr:ATP-binding protein [Marinactinospora thermotolerans]
MSRVRHGVLQRLHQLHVAGGDLDDAELMVGELVANAVRHGADPVGVVVWLAGAACAVVEVRDAGRGMPELPSVKDPAEIDPLSEGGWGLALVTRLSRGRCGVEVLPVGKSVWFALPLAGKTAGSSPIPPSEAMAVLVKERIRAETAHGRV